MQDELSKNLRDQYFSRVKYLTLLTDDMERLWVVYINTYSNSNLAYLWYIY